MNFMKSQAAAFSAASPESMSHRAAPPMTTPLRSLLSLCGMKAVFTSKLAVSWKPRAPAVESKIIAASLAKNTLSVSVQVLPRLGACPSAINPLRKSKTSTP